MSSFGACSEVQACFPIRPHTLRHRHTVLHRGNAHSLHTPMYASQKLKSDSGALRQLSFGGALPCPPAALRCAAAPPAARKLHRKKASGRCRGTTTVCRARAFMAYFCLSLLPASPSSNPAPRTPAPQNLYLLVKGIKTLHRPPCCLFYRVFVRRFICAVFTPSAPTSTTTLLLNSLFHLFPTRPLFLNLCLFSFSPLCCLSTVQKKKENVPDAGTAKRLSGLDVFAGDDVSLAQRAK